MNRVLFKGIILIYIHLHTLIVGLLNNRKLTNYVNYSNYVNYDINANTPPPTWGSISTSFPLRSEKGLGRKAFVRISTHWSAPKICWTTKVPFSVFTCTKCKSIMTCLSFDTVKTDQDNINPILDKWTYSLTVSPI